MTDLGTGDTTICGKHCRTICSDSVVSTAVVNTGYHREIMRLPNQEAWHVPRANYTSYDILCMSTQLYKDVGVKFPQCSLQFMTYEGFQEKTESKTEETSMLLYMELWRSGKFRAIDEEEASWLRDRLDKVIPEMVLLYTARDKWTISVLPLVRNMLNKKRELQVNQRKKYSFNTLDRAVSFPHKVQHLDNGLWANLSNCLRPKYKLEQFNIAIDKILKELQKSTIMATPEVARKWKLDPVGPVYQAKWRDNRFVQDFRDLMYRQMAKDYTILVDLGQGLRSVRHQVAEVLQREGVKFSFVSNYLQFSSDNFEETTRITDLVYPYCNTIGVECYVTDHYDLQVPLNPETGKKLEGVVYRNLGDSPSTLSLVNYGTQGVTVAL